MKLLLSDVQLGLVQPIEVLAAAAEFASQGTHPDLAVRSYPFALVLD